MIYLCSYRVLGDKIQRYFKCEAEDEVHAAEQLLDAEPTTTDLYCEIYERGETDANL